VEGEDNVKIKERIYETLRKEPLFSRNYDRPSLVQLRELNHRRWKRIIEMDLPLDVFGMAIASMCTKRHEEILEKTRRNEVTLLLNICPVQDSWLLLSNRDRPWIQYTEIQTTATFDNGEFVINCPSEQAIKCWAGNLSHSATHAVVFAQLYVQGKCEGVHAFVLQVRNPKTFEPLPGIVIGDMGEKPGAWNGVENGWMEFKNHRAPLWTLLNKGCDVTADGKYVSNYKSSAERQSVSLGALSIGRIGIIGKGVIASGLASTIAIRYSACRRQFGKNKGGTTQFEGRLCVRDLRGEQHGGISLRRVFLPVVYEAVTEVPFTFFTKNRL
ncbi:hypothetical protein COOONC_17594, partial [Cooperia oncophora]